jgi:uncharacterized protein (TIGR00369 family)
MGRVVWRDDGHCFACGPRNPIGLHLHFETTASGCRTRFTASKEHQGYEGIVHGGIVATLLDEVVVQMLWAMNMPAVTARLEVRFLKPAPVGEELEVEASLLQAQGRILTAVATVRDGSGHELATGTATCLRVRATSERTAAREARSRGAEGPGGNGETVKSGDAARRDLTVE